MKDDDRKIIISKISHYQQTESPFNQGMAGSQLGRWITILALIPIIVLLAVLGAFFFAAFLGLFVVAAGIFTARIWWLRRKLRKTMRSEATAQSEAESYVDIEDVQIIEETKIKQKTKS